MKAKNSIYKIFSINLLVTFGLITFICAICSALLSNQKNSSKASKQNFTNNTIRSQYPGYANEEENYAIKILEEYAAPQTNYSPFTGYRRAPFQGEAVNIGKDGFRISVNHSIKNAVWFFGGSTTWGTGADDARTIPSYFAKLSGSNVLNTGESGYSSFQELVQLQILLSRGYVPNNVIFYDGINDAHLACFSNDILPTHSGSSRFSKLERNHKELQVEHLKLKTDRDLFGVLIADIFKPVVQFYKSPVMLAKSKNFENKSQNKDLRADIKFSDISYNVAKSRCSDQDFLKKAATSTVTNWLIANRILSSYEVKPKFYLQPMLGLDYNFSNANYIINYEKKNILKNLPHYASFYAELERAWSRLCKKNEEIDCDQMVVLKSIFKYNNEPVYIDNCHLTPAGNEIVAKEIYQSFSERT